MWLMPTLHKPVWLRDAHTIMSSAVPDGKLHMVMAENPGVFGTRDAIQQGLQACLDIVYPTLQHKQGCWRRANTSRLLRLQIFKFFYGQSLFLHCCSPSQKWGCGHKVQSKERTVNAEFLGSYGTTCQQVELQLASTVGHTEHDNLSFSPRRCRLT